MAAGVVICEATLIPVSMVLNCSLVITVWQEPSLPETSLEPVFAEAAFFGQTPWIVTTGSFGATLSGLNDCCCTNGGAEGWAAGGREGACTGGVPAVWAKAHAPARREVIKIRTMDDETFLRNNEKKFVGDGLSYHTFFPEGMPAF